MQDLHRTIHRVSFSNRAQVETHAVRAEFDLIRRYQLDFFVADTSARPSLLRGCGSRAAGESRFPQIHQGTHADVELAVGEARINKRSFNHFV